eukprot:9265004-Alexandrium_andersonii.AAC.1
MSQTRLSTHGNRESSPTGPLGYPRVTTGAHADETAAWPHTPTPDIHGPRAIVLTHATQQQQHNNRNHNN